MMIIKRSDNTYDIYDVLGHLGIWNLNADCLKKYLRIMKDYKSGFNENEIQYPTLESIFSRLPFNRQVTYDNTDEFFTHVVEAGLPLQSYFDPDLVLQNSRKINRGIITPPSVSVHVNNICNFSCKWCYIDNEQKQPGMGLETEVIFHRIIKPLAQWGNFAWYLAGGEPGLTPLKTIAVAQLISDYSATLSAAKPLIALDTNGTNFTAYASAFKKAGVNTIQFSLSSPLPEVDQYFRRPRGMEPVELVAQAIRTAKAHDLYCGINMIVWQEKGGRNNLDQIEAMLDFAAHLQADFLRITPAVHVGAGTRNSEEFSLQDLQKVSRRVTEKFRKEKIKLKVFSTLLDFDLGNKQTKNTRPLMCRAGTCYMDIDHQGNIYPCSLVMPSYEIGNVLRTNIIELWRSSPLWTDWRTVVDICEECANCLYRTYCIGSCPAYAFTRFGTLHLPEKPNYCWNSQ